MHFRNRSSTCATNPYFHNSFNGAQMTFCWQAIVNDFTIKIKFKFISNFTWQILRLFWRHKLNMFGFFCVDSASLSVLVQPHINIWNQISTRGRTFAKLLRNFHLKTAVTGITELKEEENADYKHVHRSRCYGRYYATRWVLMYFDFKKMPKMYDWDWDRMWVFFFCVNTTLCTPHYFNFLLKLVFLYFWYKTHDHLGTPQMSQLSWRKQSRRSRTHWWQSLSRGMSTGKRSTWRLSPKL